MLVSLIVNPMAHRVTEERIAAVVRELSRLGEVRVQRTERPGHATELAREAEGDALLVLGGDGAFNEVLNGSDGSRPVGFLPGGHTNVLTRALGLPRDPVAAARVVARGRTRRISLGRVNGRRFAFSAGIGVDSEAVREIDRMGRDEQGRRPGDLAFARVVARLLLRGYEPCLEIRGLGEAGLVLVSNDAVYTYAGPFPIRVSPQARFELGLDAAAPERIDLRALARLVPRLAAGWGLAGARGVVSAHDVDRLEVVCGEPRPLQADGEDLGDVREAVFEAERDAVSVLC